MLSKVVLSNTKEDLPEEDVECGEARLHFALPNDRVRFRVPLDKLGGAENNLVVDLLRRSDQWMP